MSTPYLLQKALVEEIKALFVGFQLKNAREELVSLNVYPQSLPAKQDEDDSEQFPYVLVRVSEGGTGSEEDAAKCQINLLIGAYDEDLNQQGHQLVLNILQRIETHLFEKRIIDERYVVQYPYDWALNEDDVYPYFFGGAILNWQLPAIRQGGMHSV